MSAPREVAVGSVGVYRPAWTDGSDRRVLGHDEDEVTAAVAAARLVKGAGAHFDRLVLVSSAPEVLEGDTAAVIARALDDPALVVERRIGGGAAVLDALTTVPAGTLVTAVETGPGAVAAAALVADTGAVVRGAGRISRGLPGRLRLSGEAEPRVYDDPRLMRERGWREAVRALSGDERPASVVGVPAAFAKSVADAPDLVDAADLQSAAAPLLGLAALVGAGRTGRLVAVEGASGAAVDVVDAAGCTVHEEARAPLPRVDAAYDDSVEIPISLAAYERAFDAKIGLLASRCSNGHVEHPPRRYCPTCGDTEATQEPLPREAEVYTVVTIHAPVPGMRTPYSIAIASINGTDVRVLAPVTDATPGSTAIGDRGALVLRRVAVRKGIPDYGYSFQPAAPTAP